MTNQNKMKLELNKKKILAYFLQFMQKEILIPIFKFKVPY